MSKLLRVFFWMFVIGVGGPVFWVLLTLVLSSFTDIKRSTNSAEASATLDGRPFSTDVPDDLADALSFFSDRTDIQKDAVKDSYRGKLVQWTLPVWDVSKRDGGYVVQTSSSAKAAIFCNVHTTSAEELKFIAALNEGDQITCKGFVSGYTLGTVNISPAVIIR